MRVGINATAFNSLPSGAKQRLLGLFGELFRDSPHDYCVFESRNASIAHEFSGARSERVRFVRTPLRSDNTIQRVLLSKPYWRFALPRRRIDVFDTSGVSWVKHRTGVTFHTLHDIRHVTHPDMYPLRYRLVAARETRATLLNADVVITVSKTMMRQLLEYEPRARVVVLPNAIEWNETCAGPRVEEAPYLLAVGHLEKRKNYGRLIDAFERVAHAGYDGVLCIIGNPQDDAVPLRARVARSTVRDRIRLRSSIPRTELTRYYRDADLFIFPSLYEGFGIPILEAMKFGCPFVLSDLPVFREITDNKAVYFRPTDVGDMAEAITRVLSSRNAWVKTCDAIATDRRSVYSWGAVARGYARLLSEFA